MTATRSSWNAAVISLADLERLCGSMGEEPRSLPRATSGHAEQASDTSDTTEADWWDEFERELRELPTE